MGLNLHLGLELKKKEVSVMKNHPEPETIPGLVEKNRGRTPTWVCLKMLGIFPMK